MKNKLLTKTKSIFFHKDKPTASHAHPHLPPVREANYFTTLPPTRELNVIPSLPPTRELNVVPPLAPVREVTPPPMVAPLPLPSIGEVDASIFQRAELHSSQRRPPPAQPVHRITAENIRELREMIRYRYGLDIEIWKQRNLKKFMRDRVNENMRRSDAALETIRKTLTSWDRREYFETQEEHDKFKEIKDRLMAGNKIVWADNPPWEHADPPAAPVRSPYEMTARPSSVVPGPGPYGARQSAANDGRSPTQPQYGQRIQVPPQYGPRDPISHQQPSPRIFVPHQQSPSFVPYSQQAQGLMPFPQRAAPPIPRKNQELSSFSPRSPVTGPPARQAPAIPLHSFSPPQQTHGIVPIPLQPGRQRPSQLQQIRSDSPPPQRDQSAVPQALQSGQGFSSRHQTQRVVSAPEPGDFIAPPPPPPSQRTVSSPQVLDRLVAQSTGLSVRSMPARYSGITQENPFLQRE